MMFAHLVPADRGRKAGVEGVVAQRAAEEQAPETRAALPAMPLSEHVLADYQTTVCR